MQDQTGRQILSEAGFRTPDGVAGPALQSAAGLDASRERAGKAPTAKAVRAAVDSYVRINRPTRLLAVLDVSGSMGRPVPGTGGSTRLDLAIRVSVAGLAVYTDETAVGLWTFTTHLTPKTDYRQMVSVGPLGPGADGITGRERMVDALSRVKVEKGRTGLYDSVLAAVREMRHLGP